MDNYVMFDFHKDNSKEDYVKLNRGDKCPTTDKVFNPTDGCLMGYTGRCPYLGDMDRKELTTMIVINSVSCNHPDAKENEL